MSTKIKKRKYFLLQKHHLNGFLTNRLIFGEFKFVSLAPAWLIQNAVIYDFSGLKELGLSETFTIIMILGL